MLGSSGEGPGGRGVAPLNRVDGEDVLKTDPYDISVGRVILLSSLYR